MMQYWRSRFEACEFGAERRRQREQYTDTISIDKAAPELEVVSIIFTQ